MSIPTLQQNHTFRLKLNTPFYFTKIKNPIFNIDGKNSKKNKRAHLNKENKNKYQQQK